MRSSFVVVVGVLAAARAGAPPPLGNFPADVQPVTTAPPNVRVVAFGHPAPPLAQVAVAMTKNGVLAGVSVDEFGPDAVTVVADDALVDGDVVVVTVSSGAADLQTSFTVAGPDDVTPPVLTTTQLIDDSDGLVIGCLGDADAIGFVARQGGAIVSATGKDFVMVTGVSGCVDVTAVDAAANESDAVAVCGSSEGEGEGEGDGGEGEGEGDRGGCAASSSSLSLSSLSLLLLVFARSRRLWRKS